MIEHDGAMRGRTGIRVGPVQRIWVLTLAVFGFATLAAGTAAGLPTLPGSPIHLEWWHMAILFYVAEITVIHFHYRRNAHTFSLSEIPLVIGLYLADPLAVIVGHVVGTAIALTVNRRQSPLKLAFNLSQFALVSAVSIMVFRRLVPLGDPLGPTGWAATTLAALVGLLIADLLIHLAIRIAGGGLDSAEITEVFAFSAAGAVINSMLGLIAVQLAWADPRNAWLALVAPAVLFLAYRAYSSQRLERSRLQAIYLATQRLHASPHIEQAIEAAVELASEILDVEATEVLVADEAGHIYRTARGAGSTVAMEEAKDHYAPAWLRSVANGGEARLLREPVAPISGREVREAIVAPLSVGQGVVGAIVVGDRLSDVEGHRAEDVGLVGVIARQLSVSLENGQLEHSLTAMTMLKEQLESEMEARDRFVASVSHELRTPLTAIMGLASELWTDHDSLGHDETGELLGMIAEQSAELSHIIEDLLVAARADAGNLVIKAEPVGVRTEITALIAEMERSSGIDVSVDIAEVSVLADPVRLRQIVRNLLTNAERYGGERVLVDSVVGDDAVRVRVMDDGPGVPEDAAEQIFEPYQRAHNAVGTTASVGLGLAVARSLARLMDGDLCYERADGLTSFVITLPLAERSAGAAA